MKRFFYLLVGMLLIVLPTTAQDSTLGLSESDYALLTAANSTTVTRFGFEFSAQLAIEGLDTFALNTDLNGLGAVDVTSPALNLSASGDLNLGARHIPVSTEMRWVDDVLYVNFGDGWQALTGASTFLTNAIAQYSGLYGDAATLGTWDFVSIDGMSDILAALMRIDPGSFLNALRLDDEQVNGVNTAHFQLNADLHALMQTDSFVDLIGALAVAQGNNLVIYNHDELAEIVRANSVLFENAALTLDQYVGLEDGFIHRATIHLILPLDPSAADYPDAPFMITANLDMTQSDQNQPQEISVPENAAPVTRFAIPMPPNSDVPVEGKTQYVFFETIGEGEVFTQPIDVEAGDSITITVRGLGLDFDSNAALRSPDGETLAENDDHETTAFAVNDLDSQIVDFQVSETGIYGVEIADVNGAAGSFVLTISIRR